MGSDPDIRKAGRELCVSIHAPAWGATWTTSGNIFATRFNSRSRMGSDGRHALRHPQLPSFNSRSRMGSDTPPTPRASSCSVSIHAPAWGATSSLSGLVSMMGFQFTLPHGERPLAPGRKRPRTLFQFTLPHGERPARAGGAGNQQAFQFTLPHGERLCLRGGGGEGGGFNSRSRMGSDMSAPQMTFPRNSFNSRSRMGSDGGDSGEDTPPQVSIHAPAWGATTGLVNEVYVYQFQFTLPHGERLDEAESVQAQLMFQFTLPHGERPPPCGRVEVDAGFQFTLPHGERPGASPPGMAMPAFQFTLPHGERPWIVVITNRC